MVLLARGKTLAINAPAVVPLFVLREDLSNTRLLPKLALFRIHVPFLGYMISQPSIRILPYCKEAAFDVIRISWPGMGA